MKKPHTEQVNMTFSGPVTMLEQALLAMRALGFEAKEELPQNHTAEGSIPWREASAFKDLSFPGAYLAGFRYREGITQADLAERTGIPRRHISEMENGKRPIGKQNARKLADVLHIEPRLLLTV